MQTQFDYERLARIARNQTERIRRLEQEREQPGTVQQVRRVTEESTAMTETVTLTDMESTHFVWDESEWGFADWGP